MKTIYFVRHGESESNADGMVRGPITALTEKGHRQAQQVAARFRNIRHDVVVSSDYPRALDTARAIAHLHAQQPVICEHIHERVNPTFFTGKHVDDPDKRAVENAQLERWASGDDGKHSDEETFADLRTRAARAQAWFEARPEERIVAVTHGTFLRLFQAHLLFGNALTPDIFVRFVFGLKTANTGITMYEVHDELKFPWDIRWKLRTWMDIAHLGD